MPQSQPNGWIIGFAPDLGQPMNFYWNGVQQTPVNNSSNPYDAIFYLTSVNARTAAAALQQRYPSQQVSYVPAYKSVVLMPSNSPDLLPPAAAPANGNTTSPQ